MMMHRKVLVITKRMMVIIVIGCDYDDECNDNDNNFDGDDHKRVINNDGDECDNNEISQALGDVVILDVRTESQGPRGIALYQY